MKIVFFGNTKYSTIGLKIIHQTYPVSLVVTIPDRIVGREKALTPSPVKQIAEQLNIPILEADKLDTTAIEKIAELNPDFLVVEDYGLILPQKLLDIPKYAPLNIHHSLLPKYRGPAPAPAAILAGEKISGVTIIKMTNSVDAGDMLAQQEYQLSETETTDSLLTYLNKVGGKLLIQVLSEYLAGKEKPITQDEAKAIFTQRMHKENGYFDIDSPPSPETLDRMIRAYFPWPNVWTRWSPSSHPEAKPKDLKIVKFYPEGMIQMEGKKPQSLKDFLNGYPDFPLKNI